MSACSGTVQLGRGELEGTPGVFTFSSGRTTHLDMFQQGAQLLSNGDYQAAESVYRRLIVLEPENESGYIGLGSSLFFQERYDEARQAYTQAIELTPESAEAYIGLGSVAWKIGDLDTALDDYSKALDLDESNADAHWGMAIALEAQGHPGGAISHLKRVLELAPGSRLADLAQAQLDELQAGSKP